MRPTSGAVTVTVTVTCTTRRSRLITHACPQLGYQELADLAAQRDADDLQIIELDTGGLPDHRECASDEQRTSCDCRSGGAATSGGHAEAPRRPGQQRVTALVALRSLFSFLRETRRDLHQSHQSHSRWRCHEDSDPAAPGRPRRRHGDRSGATGRSAHTCPGPHPRCPAQHNSGSAARRCRPGKQTADHRWVTRVLSTS